MHFPYAAKISTTAHGPFVEASGPGPLRVLLMLGMTACAVMGVAAMMQMMPRRRRRSIQKLARSIFT
jgi:hypothetical protein